MQMTLHIFNKSELNNNSKDFFLTKCRDCFISLFSMLCDHCLTTTFSLLDCWISLHPIVCLLNCPRNLKLMWLLLIVFRAIFFMSFCLRLLTIERPNDQITHKSKRHILPVRHSVTHLHVNSVICSNAFIYLGNKD